MVPNIIKGVDFSLSFCSGNFLDKGLFVSLFLLLRFEKGLFTLKKLNKLLGH